MLCQPSANSRWRIVADCPLLDMGQGRWLGVSTHSEVHLTVDQDKTMSRRGRPPVAVPQRLRRTLRQVWHRSHWGSTMTRRWRLLLRRLDGEGETASSSQSKDGSEDK